MRPKASKQNERLHAALVGYATSAIELGKLAKGLVKRLRGLSQDQLECVQLWLHRFTVLRIDLQADFRMSIVRRSDEIERLKAGAATPFWCMTPSPMSVTRPVAEHTVKKVLLPPGPDRAATTQAIFMARLLEERVKEFIRTPSPEGKDRLLELAGIYLDEKRGGSGRSGLFVQGGSPGLRKQRS